MRKVINHRGQLVHEARPHNESAMTPEQVEAWHKEKAEAEKPKPPVGKPS